jgi:hypothetical protein
MNPDGSENSGIPVPFPTTTDERIDKFDAIVGDNKVVQVNKPEDVSAELISRAYNIFMKASEPSFVVYDIYSFPLLPWFLFKKLFPSVFLLSFFPAPAFTLESEL